MYSHCRYIVGFKKLQTVITYNIPHKYHNQNLFNKFENFDCGIHLTVTILITLSSKSVYKAL